LLFDAGGEVDGDAGDVTCMVTSSNHTKTVR
jgi:hypothetical protein